MTASASTIQYNRIPTMSCQISTESPKDAPNDSATVPTMTNAATTLRVMNIMISKIGVSAAIPAIHEVVFRAVLDVLVGRGSSGQVDFADPARGCSLNGLLRCVSDGRDVQKCPGG